jgi:hypothetical protein
LPKGKKINWQALFSSSAYAGQFAEICACRKVGPNVIKVIMAQFMHVHSMFECFQPSIMFASKAEAYLSEAHESTNFQGRLFVLPTNVRQGWKGLDGISTQANYEHL